MTYDQFLNEWNGKYIAQYGGQCVAVAAEYEAENNLPIVWANACDWINNPVMLGAYDWIQNNPSDPNQMPSRGDIIIWDSGLPGSYGAGHIAFFDAVLGVGSFQSFGANWGGPNCHFQTHTWAHVAGWYTRKPAEQVQAPIPTPDPVHENPPPEPVVPPASVIIPPAMPSGALPITSPLYDKVIIKQIPGYDTMTDAQHKTNPIDVVSPGVTYYLRTSQGGMDKLATDSSGANAIWINPAMNEPDPTPVEAAKTTLDDIKKQWDGAPTAVTVAKALVNTAPVDNSWKTMTPFVNKNGQRVAHEYKVVKQYQATDLDGRTAATVSLQTGQIMAIAGTFRKDGIKYYRPQKAADTGRWWGIPFVDKHGDSIIEEDTVLTFFQADPSFIATPVRRINAAQNLGAAKASVENFEAEVRRGLTGIMDIIRKR